MNFCRFSIIAVLWLVVPLLAVQAQLTAEDSIRAIETADATPMRIVETPTMNFPTPFSIHADGMFTFYSGIGKNDRIQHHFIAGNIGVSLLEGHVYIEAGVDDFQTYNEYDSFDNDPLRLMYGIRGAMNISQNTRLGVAYRVVHKKTNDISWSISVPLNAHIATAGITTDNGYQLYTANVGLGFRGPLQGDDYGDEVFPVVSLGGKWWLSRHFSIVQDFGIYNISQYNPFFWFWTGLRYRNGPVTVDVAAFTLIFGFTVQVGVTL